jgi:hypothetical protein
MRRVMCFYSGRAVALAVLSVFVVGPCEASHPRKLTSKNSLGRKVPDQKIAVVQPEIPEPDDQNEWQDPDALPPTFFGHIDFLKFSSPSPSSAER